MSDDMAGTMLCGPVTASIIEFIDETISSAKKMILEGKAMLNKTAAMIARFVS